MGQRSRGERGTLPRRPGHHPDMGDILPELVWNTTAEDLRALAEKALARHSWSPMICQMQHLHAHPVRRWGDQIAAMTDQLGRAGQCRFALS